MLSIITFTKYYLTKPYYNDTIMLVFYIFSLVFVWANICLLIAKILEKTTFCGGL